MDSIALQFAGGNGFFAGAALLAAAAALSFCVRGRPWRGGVNVVAFVALPIIALSATPLSPWLYAAWAAAVAWFLVARVGAAEAARWRRWAPPAGVLVLTLGAAAVELPWRVDRGAMLGPSRRAIVIGDSISAGIGGEVRAWPALLRDRRQLDLTDLSAAGLRIAGARERARSLTPEQLRDAVVILEIGGNDLLGGADAASFEADLTALLNVVSGKARAVVMFELPLPPLYNAFGRAQRRLAARYGVVLISKSRFAAVLRGQGATVDGLHLSAVGHECMAEVVSCVLLPDTAGSGDRSSGD